MLVPDTSFGYGDEDMAKQKVRFGGQCCVPHSSGVLSCREHGRFRRVGSKGRSVPDASEYGS